MFSLNSNCKDFIETVDILLKLIGGLGAFYLFFIGFRRYSKDQEWKRNEFVSKEVKEFMSDLMVGNTIHMLDYGSRMIELYPQKNIYEERFVSVNREVLKLALQHHSLRNKLPGKDKFTSLEVSIRDNFDQFLYYIERFDQFIEAGLITVNELQPYLQYLIDTIATNLEQDIKNVLYHYINEYRFTGVQQLFRRFNKDIVPKTILNSTI